MLPKPPFPVFPSLPPDASWWDAVIFGLSAPVGYIGSVLVWCIDFLFWAFFSGLAELSETVVGFMIEPPEWLGGVGDSLSWAVSSMNRMCSWVDLGNVAIALGIVGGAWGLGLIVRVVRIVASFMTAGGGMGS